MTSHEPIRLLGEVPFHPRQRELWRSGELRKQWAENYEFLFDGDDRRLADSQGPLGYHFFEWLGAITLFHSTGYWSLQGKYEFPKHDTKNVVTVELLPEEVHRIIRTRPRRAQCPDLLAYWPDGSDWFFCEVKGPRDRLSPSQLQLFAALAQAGGRSVGLLRFKDAGLVSLSRLFRGGPSGPAAGSAQES